jgi:hypothetical protein
MRSHLTAAGSDGEGAAAAAGAGSGGAGERRIERAKLGRREGREALADGVDAEALLLERAFRGGDYPAIFASKTAIRSSNPSPGSRPSAWRR